MHELALPLLVGLIAVALAFDFLNGLHDAVRARGISVETIGDANAPRGTYEAVFEGHRAGRRV